MAAFGPVQWKDFLRAATGSGWGAAEVGYALTEGRGVAKNIAKGATFISIAAGKGSDYGAVLLGLALADGKYGLPNDRSEAIYWLMKALSGSCDLNHCDEHELKQAQEKLDELLERQT